jgi:arginyl-tRNA synthetase
MDIKNTIKQAISQVLAKKYNLAYFEFEISYPPTPEMGDYACSVAMSVAKNLNRKPLEVAEEIASELNTNKEFKNIKAVAPGFINFFLSEESLKKNLKEILKEKDNYGKQKIGKGKKIIIDYSAPNVAKNMHAGHLRSTIIGDALARLFEFLGYKVLSDNHVGDWGTQYGILIYQYKNKFGNKIKNDLAIDDLEKMYVDFMNAEKEDKNLREIAKAELKKLQDGDKENLKLWKYFCEISKVEFIKIYDILKIRKFDLWQGESFYNNELNKIVETAIKDGVAEKSEGAIIINLDKFNLPAMLIQKSDDAFLYATTDLATLEFRHKKINPAKILYVVANQQALHFEQLFVAGKLLELYSNEELTHIKFGLLLGTDGKKMSTREGGVVKLIDLMSEIVSKAREVVEEKNPNLSDREKKEIAQKVGLGALKYNDLSQNRLSDIVFDWEKMLSFESGSAPYLQYTFVRIRSILNKAFSHCHHDDQRQQSWEEARLDSTIKTRQGSRSNLDLLTKSEEINLMRQLAKFKEILVEAGETYRPNLLANYLDALAVNFHAYYEHIPILKAEEKVSEARLTLISAVAVVIENGLKILGIEVMERM